MKNISPTQKPNHPMDRRSFIKISGLLGIGIAATPLIPATAEAVKFNRKLYKVSKTRLAMGTFVSITTIHPSRDLAEEAIGTAFEEINRLTKTLSRFDRRTAVAQLNREGFLKEIPPELAGVMRQALAYNKLSAGHFDITVKPLVDLFKDSFARGGGAAPGEKELDRALRLVGSENVSLEGTVLRFKHPGMGITLDGIAKGYIVDRTADKLSALGIENFLINAGGDIRTRGSRYDRKPWKIAIQDPQKKGIYPDVLRMKDGAVATSGNYEVFFDREKMFHHIVDPVKGISPQLTSVSVLSKTAMDADALSTSVFVMGAVRGTHFIDSRPGCEALIIGEGNRKTTSAGWKGVSA